ncbi:MAG TPA: glycosyltransferase family 87 protein, partial [Phycisphaerae bacterium]|nr:glycosyltransferase family 87 protein [Phycisphaerae bacterium]
MQDSPGQTTTRSHAPHPARLARAAATPPVRTLARAMLLAILASLAFVGWRAAMLRAPDFEFFYKGGRWLIDHGSMDRGVDLLPAGGVVPRGTIEWYLPFVSRLMTLLAWLPQQTAGAVWLGLNLAAAAAVARLTAVHLMGFGRQAWEIAVLVPVLVLIVAWYWEFRLNQINVLTLLLLLASFVHWRQGRGAVAGFWLGLAILLKLTPALLLAWFGLKREWRTVAVACATIAVAGPLADVAALGPRLTAETYRLWWHEAVVEGSHRGNIVAQREMDWRNQATGAVLCRWLHPTSWSLRFDNDPRARVVAAEQYLNIADWPREHVATLVQALSLASVVLLAWLARRPARQLGEWQLRAEYALFVLAMLWLMPVMRGYHLIWALPALGVPA